VQGTISDFQESRNELLVKSTQRQELCFGRPKNALSVSWCALYKRDPATVARAIDAVALRKRGHLHFDALDRLAQVRDVDGEASRRCV
jgi:hypothetical protein